MDIDPTDSFYQQLDSEELLKHSPGLVKQARELLIAHPEMRVAGLIAMRDSEEAKPLLQTLTAAQRQQAHVLSTLVARRGFEDGLTKRCGTKPWLEEAGEPQRVLAVVVATRDGHRFGFFTLDGAGLEDARSPLQ